MSIFAYATIHHEHLIAINLLVNIKKETSTLRNAKHLISYTIAKRIHTSTKRKAKPVYNQI